MFTVLHKGLDGLSTFYEAVRVEVTPIGGLLSAKDCANTSTVASNCIQGAILHQLDGSTIIIYREYPQIASHQEPEIFVMNIHGKTVGRYPMN